MRLYKYVDSHIVNILEEQRLKVTPLLDLNDPFESLPSFDLKYNMQQLKRRFLRKDGIREMWERNPSYQKKYRSFKDFVREMKDPKMKNNIIEKLNDQENIRRIMMGTISEQRRNGYLLSLSEEPMNILMWAHYSKSHSGAVIEFDCGNAPHFQKYLLHKVHYTNERPTINPICLTGEMKENFSKAFLSKSVHWNYEKEWRTIFHTGLLVCDTEWFLMFNPKYVTSVILGCNMKPEIRSKARQLLEQKEWKHVQVKQAQLDFSEYKLTIEDL